MAPAATEEKEVSIINQGATPMQTERGLLAPGQALSVPESLAVKLLRAYRHLKRASDIVPSVKAGEALLKEKAALEAKVKDLEAQLGEATGKVSDLSGRLQEFLSAGSKKDLDALQEKHADAVPEAAPAA